MTEIINVNRRLFLKKTGAVGGAFILGASMPGLPVFAATNATTSAAQKLEGSELGVFVSIDKKGAVQIFCHRMEMGQGIFTSVPQIIADELGADWSKVEAKLAPGDSKFGDQSTGGSASIRRFFKHTRQMGAVARDMLETAAANTWGVAKSEVAAKHHFIVHAKSGKKLSFGELAESAAALPVPSVDTVTLKSNSEFSLIGKDVELQGQHDIVKGKTTYAQDIQLPNMLIASIERPPVLLGKVKSFDATEAKKVAGVVDVIQLKDRGLPVLTNPVSGVAVLATNTWAAIEGRKKLKVEWDHGDNVAHNSETYKQDLVAKVNTRGVNVRSEGDVYTHSYNSDRTLEATYTVPYHHHMSMETPAATAVIENGGCTVWSGTQAPQWGKGMVFQELGLDPAKDANKVVFNTTFMGGAFGRKGKNDFTIEAVELAKATGKAVKVVWSREDDVKHGFYHSIAANYYKAELTEDNRADNFICRVAHPPINWIFNAGAETPSDMLLSQSFGDIPFDVNSISVEVQKVTTHLRIGWFRSVQNLHNAFAMGSFVDELAHKAKVTPRKMWLDLIGKDRLIDFAQEGFEKWVNYGQTTKQYAVDTKRMKHVLNLVADKAGVEEPLPENEGWGLGYATSFNAYAAAATKVRVVNGKVEVLEMHTAIDCGLVVTPDRVRSQMEGAMIMGHSISMFSEITVKDGEIEQSNFHDYSVSRINQTPPLFVHIVDSKEAPGGVGESGFPPIMPSVANAVFHASGVRVRDMPINKHFKV